MKKQRILVTGSSGYIGQHLTKHLKQLPNANIYGFSRTYDIHLPAAQCFEGNLLTADLLGWLTQIRPDIIFHCIGVSPRAPFDEQLLLNVEGTRRLLQAVMDSNLRPKILILGSSAEYGLRDEPVSEQAVCQPESEYGIAKLAQTQVAQSFARRYDLPVMIARLFNVYGASSRHRMVASLAAQLVQAETLYPLPTEMHSYNLRSRRDFIHVDDACEALIKLAALSHHNEIRGQIYNVASGQSTALSTILEQLLAHCTLSKAELKSVELILHGKQTEDTSWANISKITQHTGWTPQIALDQGLSQEMHYWRANLGNLVPVTGSASLRHPK